MFCNKIIPKVRVLKMSTGFGHSAGSGILTRPTVAISPANPHFFFYFLKQLLQNSIFPILGMGKGYRNMVVKEADILG